MNHYAIGKPNQTVRIIISSEFEEAATINCKPGEVFVEIEAHARGSISPDGTAFIPAGLDMKDEEFKIRERRTALIAQTDWIMFPDSPITGEALIAWKAYRQALRDITETQPNKTFDEIIWPQPPE